MLRCLFVLLFLLFNFSMLGQQLESYNNNEIIFLDEYETECTEEDARYVRVFDYDKGTQLYIARDYAIGEEKTPVRVYYYSEIHPNKRVKTVYFEDGNQEVVLHQDGDITPVRCVKIKNEKEIDCSKKKDGDYTEYYNEGYSEGIATGTYNKGKRIGEWKYEIGGREIYTNYNNNGQIEGLEYEILSYDNSKDYERTYKNGKLNGWSTKWHSAGYVDELGGIEARIKYKDNAPVDTAFWYYHNGQKEVELIFYPNDNKVWKTTWYESGTKSSEGWQVYEGAVNPRAISQWAQFSHYADKIGTWKMWHPNGNLSAEIIYKNGIREGKCVRYYDNQQKSYEATFVNGYLEGSAKTWHPNGQLKSEGQFFDGEKVGQWQYFDKNGQHWELNDETIFGDDFQAPMNLSNPAYYLLKLQLIWMAEAVLQQDWESGIKLCAREHFSNQFGYTHQNAYQGVPNTYYGSNDWRSFRNGYMISLMGMNYMDSNIGGDISLIDRIIYTQLSDEGYGYMVKLMVYLHDGTTREGRIYIDKETFRFFSSFG